MVFRFYSKTDASPFRRKQSCTANFAVTLIPQLKCIDAKEPTMIPVNPFLKFFSFKS